MLPATKGLNVFTICTRLLAHAIQSGTAAISEGGSAIGDVQLGSIGAAIGALFEKIEPGQMAGLAKDLLQSTEISIGDGEWESLKEGFDDHFAGKYKTLYQVAGWVFEVNFQEVFTFSSIASKLKAVLADQKSKGSTSEPSSASHAEK